jgi:hypothetical protein
MSRPHPHTVLWDPDAIRDLTEQVKGKGERIAVYTAVEKLRALGTQLAPPHTKTLDGFKPSLMELRPRQGRSDTRPLYRRFGERYVILAVAASHESVNKAGSVAQDRARQYEDRA